MQKPIGEMSLLELHEYIATLEADKGHGSRPNPTIEALKETEAKLVAKLLKEEKGE